MKKESVLVVSADSTDALEASAATNARRLTFGLNAGEFRAEQIRIGSEGARFSITRGGAPLERDILLPIGGRMNVANALAVYVRLREYGIESSAIVRGMARFSGVARRQEVVGEAGGITIIDDFAHHPTAIKATIDAVGERFAGRRVLAAFEPRSNTARRNVFQADFATAFDRAARVYLAPVFFKDNDPILPNERLSTAALASEISARGTPAFACESNEQLLERMLSELRSGDVALIMSNGAFERMPVRLFGGLQERYGGSGP
jgi:UDP-N-acetylmuramate: L-alanyl-gamma-D-glutamyl-meso-diaminopimelate ligase